MTYSNLNAWTPELSSLITGLWKKGKSATEISKALASQGVKKTRNSVIGRLHRMGVTVNDRPYEVTRAHRIACEDKSRQKKSRVSATNQAKGALARRYNADLRGSEPKYVAKPLPDISSPNARPWSQRKLGECSWPIGERHDIKSCCNPVSRGSFCLDHAAVGYQEPAPTKDPMRLAKRFG